MVRKVGLRLLIILTAMSVVAGCGAEASNSRLSEPEQKAVEKKAEQKTPAEPIELILYSGTTLTDDEFQTFIQGPVKKKFPNITIKLERKDDVNTRESIAVTKQFPDIIYDSDSLYWGDNGLKLIEPLDSYIKKFKFDTSTIEPYLLRDQKQEGVWKTLPISGNFVINWINKDVFDKFGVPVPAGLLSWEQITELNHKLTGNRDGVQYVGMYPDFHFMGQGLSLVYIDPATNKATVNNDQWKRILNVVKNNVEIPGFIQGNKYNYRRNEWLKDRNVAMAIATGNQMIGPLTELYDSGQPMNWDMGAYPNFKEKLGISPATGGTKIMLSNQSKHKDEAFQVMAYLLSKDVQMLISQTGKIPSIKDPKVKEAFGTGVASLKGKNTKAIFLTTPAAPVPATEWNSTIGKKVVDGYVKKMVLEQMDINTALRKAEEDINSQMAEVLNGKK